VPAESYRIIGPWHPAQVIIEHTQTDVGYSVGFSEPSYFTRMFKKLVGALALEALGVGEFD
jgi:AraC-like DNA-binding protein